MSAVLQLFFTLLWWLGLATLATCLGLIALVVYGTVADRWRERTERAVRR